MDADTYAEAARLLTERGEDHAHRRANSADYTLTGLMRCPTCSSAMIGTRAHGKTKVYRYYTCHSHYDSTKCAGHRLNADECETEILHALANFYRNHHTLIADTITNAQREHHAGRDAQHAELTAVNAKITDTNTKIDRYRTAFENGTMDEQLIGERLNHLRTTAHQLTAHRDQLSATLEDAPTGPDPADLTALAEHITTVITTGPDQARKALIETLVTEIKITGPDTLRPLFRIPNPQPTPNQPKRP